MNVEKTCGILSRLSESSFVGSTTCSIQSMQPDEVSKVDSKQVMNNCVKPPKIFRIFNRKL